MANITCPVTHTIVYLADKIRSGVLNDPKGRRISQQVLALVEEIAEGAAGENHFAAIQRELQHSLHCILWHCLSS